MVELKSKVLITTVSSEVDRIEYNHCIGGRVGHLQRTTSRLYQGRLRRHITAHNIVAVILACCFEALPVGFHNLTLGHETQNHKNEP